MIPLARTPDRFYRARRAWVAVGSVVVAFVVCAVLAPAALALARFDFEQKYLVHPRRQVWDFCLVRPDSVYHIFYHTIHEDTPHASYADTIWHATSADLKHWYINGPVLTAGPESWDAGAVWAPDVVYDPDSDSWAMLYTGVDIDMNQRTCLAVSPDLDIWSKSAENPVLEPDSEIYYWDADGTWSDFRDPFLFFADGEWNMLNTAVRRLDDDGKLGVLHRSVSSDLVNWTEVGDFFAHDGDDSWHVLESSQYHVRGPWHHLYFGEWSVYGISHVSATDPSAWTMADRHTIDWGNAPEIKQFDADIDIIGRIGAYRHPQTDVLMYAVRFDTLLYDNDGALPDPYRPHPFDTEWASREGASNLGNPCFGDNTSFRGDPPCGLVGNSWYGSKEYYQGPLSSRGSPGSVIGDQATGILTSYPFYVVGNRMTLLVGGGNFPQTCYVALVDAESDTILLSETGANHETMSMRYWNLEPYQDRLVYIQIVDQESSEFGHINVDEVIEKQVDPSATTGAVPAAVAVVDRGPSPNPFNPATQFRFRLNRAGTYRINVHDLHGRVLWTSRPVAANVGDHRVGWNGTHRDGAALASGVYLYTIVLDGQLAASGKLSLVK